MQSFRLFELNKSTVLSYINKAQDRDRYFSVKPDRITQRLKSFTTAQKKIGQSQTKPKIMAVNRESILERLFNILESFDNTPRIHQDISTPLLKHLAKNSKTGTMKFYLSSNRQEPQGHMYSGDAYYYTHHSLGARPSQIFGAISYHKPTDSYHYTAKQYSDGKYIDVHHERLNNFDKLGIKKGVWDSDNATVHPSQ